jgi:hypothetical protein
VPDRLAEAALPSFYAEAWREYKIAVEREGLVECRLRFADRTVRLDFAGPRLADALLGAFAERRDDGTGPVHATIALWEEDARRAGSVPVPWLWEDIGPGGLVRGLGVDAPLVVHETCSGAVTLVNPAGPATLYRVPHTEAIPWWETAAPLRASLFWALGGERRHLVHAGVVGDDRGGVLLVGSRGSGKTTVAMAAVHHGLRLVADDYILLDAANGQAISLYNTVSVRAAPGSDEKTVVDLASSMPGSLCASLPVRAIVAPCLSGGRTQVRRVSPGTALRAWAPSTVFHMPYDDGAVVSSLADVVGSFPCFALDVGNSQADLARAVVEVLDQAAP